MELAAAVLIPTTPILPRHDQPEARKGKVYELTIEDNSNQRIADLRAASFSDDDLRASALKSRNQKNLQGFRNLMNNLEQWARVPEKTKKDILKLISRHNEKFKNSDKV